MGVLAQDLLDFLRKWFGAAKPPLFRLSSLNYSPNIPDFDCKIRLDKQKTGSFSCSQTTFAGSLLNKSNQVGAIRTICLAFLSADQTNLVALKIIEGFQTIETPEQGFAGRRAKLRDHFCVV